MIINGKRGNYVVTNRVGDIAQLLIIVAIVLLYLIEIL